MRRDIVRSVVRKQRDKRLSIAKWAGRLPNVPAFILGNGPSLSDENLALLSEHFTIGINRTFLLIDPTILMWQDISLWNSEAAKLDALQAIKLARNTADPQRLYYNFHLRGGGYAFKPQIEVLYGSGSTGPLACELAVALGCSPIIILGMDCTLGTDGRTDFYGTNVYWGPRTLDACQDGLKYIKEHCPVPIINCAGTNLWPRQALPAVMEQFSAYAWGREAYTKRILSGA
jgi:hypothetical protein